MCSIVLMIDLSGGKTVLFQLLGREDFLPFCPERAQQDVFLFGPKNIFNISFLLFSKLFSYILS